MSIEFCWEPEVKVRTVIWLAPVRVAVIKRWFVPVTVALITAPTGTGTDVVITYTPALDLEAFPDVPRAVLALIAPVVE